MIRFATVLQSHWDWRAAGNFVLGGAGSGLLALVAVAAFGAATSPWTVLFALALIGAGLGCVWLEIGRPWRALNVFRHPQRSWMTREGMVATLVFALGFAAITTRSELLLAAAGLAALGFLYCQALILRAAKGVPTWREPAIVPLVVATGLAEGCGLLALLGTLGELRPVWLPWALAAFALLRAVAWRRYRGALAASQAPAAAQSRLARIDAASAAGGVGVAVVAVGAAFAPAPLGAALLALAGVAAIAAGWILKATIVTRAANLQGYAFGKLKRGHPLARSRTPNPRTTR